MPPSEELDTLIRWSQIGEEDGEDGEEEEGVVVASKGKLDGQILDGLVLTTDPVSRRRRWLEDEDDPFEGIVSIHLETMD